MEKQVKLYPFKFVPIQANETENYLLADLGYIDSEIASGAFAGNTIDDMMETYLEKMVGEELYQYYGRQFPLMVKTLNVSGRTPVKVDPCDADAEPRFDALGGAGMWYVMDAQPGSKIYLGFEREVSATELYNRCLDGSLREVMHEITPRRGDAFYLRPGTLYAAEGRMSVVHVKEASDVSFTLCSDGEVEDLELQVAEALDLVDYRPFDPQLYIPSHKEKCFCGHHHEGEDCDHHHHEGEDCDHHHHEVEGCGHHHEDEVVRKLAQTDEFTLNDLKVRDALHIYTEKFGRFIIYICIAGEVSIQVPLEGEKGAKKMENYYLKAGECVLIPASMQDFFLVPVDRDSVLLEAMVEKREEDAYINPDTDPFLEGEDYEGVEDECDCDDDDCDCGHCH